MAEIILSALLPIVFEKLVSVVSNKFADHSKEIQSELKKWNASLLQIRKLLNDAAQKEITDESVKDWLNRLQHLAYDIDDELDALATEAAMHPDDQEPPRNITSKVKKLIPTCCTTSAFSSTTKMHNSKLNDITTRLQELYDEKDNLGLTIKNERSSQDINRSYQTSLLSPGIVGRDGEKNILLKKLLADHEPTANQYNFSIMPIVGMGGLGKTTLARLLYNEPKVNEHFELKAWVCVSDEFDSFNISKLIYESVASQKKKFENPNMLQEALRSQLSGKRFLLVLDDVWSENIEDWNTMVPPFHGVASGSKIIITTRKEKLIQQLGCDNPFYLNKLPHGDALSLFAQHALGANNFDSSPKLRSYGESIVRKCDGLPLALKALGSLLRTKRNEEKWKELLESEIWSLEDDAGILPALRLSYLDLSARLKHLFAYSCLFPKDYVFDKEDLILLWMAEGFLHGSKSSKSMECLGEEYFDELLSRSFFQHVPDKESLFVMHDLMNDLATSVAGEFFIRLDIEKKHNMEEHDLKKYRHMSFVREKFMSLKKFKTVEKANALRTFLAVPVDMRGEGMWKNFYPSRKILVDLLPRMPLLRALCLSKLKIDEIPESVGDLKHLRYLNVSRTPITHLPDSVCNLYNLQTLIVFGCEKLKKLPDNFLKLKNLRHFDNRDTPLLKNMSLGVGEMKSLQTLSKISFSIGEENKFPTSGLRNLKNLRRKVCIDGLDKLHNIDQARKLNLSQMKVSELVMEWSDDFDGSRKQRLGTEVQVLDVLKPHSDNLKKLEVVSYGGTKFPKWVGDSSFCKLNVVHMSKCRNCLFLPPLGQLPSLKQLFISSMDDVKEVGPGLFGENESPAFPSLEILSFSDMARWEEWSVNADVTFFPCLEELIIINCPNMARWEVNADVRVFRCLQELTVCGCPNLVKVSLEVLPSLRVLYISKCGGGVLKSLVGVAASVTEMSIEGISGLSDEVWAGVVQHLKALEELRIEGCNEIRNLWESGEEEVDACKEVLVNLKKLEIGNCDELVRIGRGGEKEEEGSNLPASLRMLEITSCTNLKHLSCPDSIETLRLYKCQNLEHLSCQANTIQMLRIHECESLTSASFPSGGGEGWQKLKSLEVLSIRYMGLENLIFMTKATCFLQQLMKLKIRDCGEIESFPDLKDLVSLKHLQIRNCEKIESFPDLKDLVSLKHLRITDCTRMDGPLPLVGSGVWPPNLDSLIIGCLKRPISEWGPLPNSLAELTLLGRFYGSSSSAEGEEDVKSFPTSSSLLPYSLSSSLNRLILDDFKRMERISSEGLQHLTSLQHLSIEDCPRLKHLPEGLQHLTSLQHLDISFCPRLKHLPVLPTLLSFTIRNCNEELKEKMMSRRGSYWPLLSHIPRVSISTELYQR